MSAGLIIRKLVSAILVWFLFCQCAHATPLSLWRINNDRATVYLLGSIHALKPEMYPLAAEINHAFKRSDKTVFEVDIAEVSSYEMSLVIQQRGTYIMPKTIESELSSETIRLLRNYLDQNNLDFAEVRQLRPWLLSMRISLMELTKLGYSSDLGIDYHYQQMARREGKPILQLETVMQQIDFLAADPPKIQDISLRYLLEEIQQVDRLIAELMSAWQEGEADKMYEISVQSSLDHPELEAQLNRLLDDRNVAMVKKIDSYLATADTYFVVVGALHMGGPRGILRLLGKDHDVVQLHHCSE